jgi:hypothetical protein
MNRFVLFITSLSLVTTSLNLSNYANAHDDNIRSTHIDSKSEFPHNRWATVRQTIQIHIPQSSQALAQLSIDIPRNIEFEISKIEILAGDRTISASISRQGQQLQIKFDRPIEPNTTLKINFNSVKRNIYPQLSVYYLYGKVVGGVDSYIGEAYFPQ